MLRGGSYCSLIHLPARAAGNPTDHDLSSYTQILELLCQILQTDSLRAIQFWLLYAPPKGEDPQNVVLSQLLFQGLLSFR